MINGDLASEYIEQLYREMFLKLYIYALKTVRDPSLAEEAVQNTFCIACERENKLLESKNPRGWLMNVLKNVIRNSLRERAKLAVAIMDVLEENDTEVATSHDLDLDTLYSDVAKTEDFQLLKRLALEDCSILEISEDLGLSIETCKKRVQRARKRLQKK